MKTLFLWVILTAGSASRVDTLQRQLRPFKSLKGTFVQTQQLKGIRKPLVSRGTFALSQGRGILWQTQKPFVSAIRINPSGIAQVKDGKVTSLVSSRDQPRLEEMGKLFSALFSADVEALKPQFEFISVEAPQNAPWKAVLKPSDPGMGKVVDSLVLTGQHTVEGLTLFEHNGDVTVIRFSDLKPDEALSREEAAALE